jgi:hypothetical protein
MRWTLLGIAGLVILVAVGALLVAPSSVAQEAQVGPALNAEACTVAGEATTPTAEATPAAAGVQSRLLAGGSTLALLEIVLQPGASVTVPEHTSTLALLYYVVCGEVRLTVPDGQGGGVVELQGEPAGDTGTPSATIVANGREFHLSTGEGAEVFSTEHDLSNDGDVPTVLIATQYIGVPANGNPKPGCWPC